jgi:hypothetical protein
MQAKDFLNCLAQNKIGLKFLNVYNERVIMSPHTITYYTYYYIVLYLTGGSSFLTPNWLFTHWLKKADMLDNLAPN